MSTLINKGIAFIISALLLMSGNVMAQENVLDQYIREAFKNNEGLHQQQFQLEKTLYALKEARSLFLPNISLQGSYLKSDGGRTIDLPVGDLLNPLYSSLNQLTQTSSFPQIKNESVQLNPDNYYDAKFHTTLPLINAEIYYNNKIKKQLMTRQQAAINVYKRELVKNIKDAYYQYYQAGKAIDIYKNSLSLVNENIRINESLLRNGVRNGTALTRSQTEKQKIEALITQAENNKLNAQYYFNFLLNKPQSSDITIDTLAFSDDAVLQMPGAKDFGGREELQQLKTATEAYKLNTQMQRSSIIPKLNTFLDLGSQGFDFKYNNKTQYYMWGLSLQWDLFAGGQHRYKTQQALADVHAIEAQYSETEKALQLQLSQSLNNYNTAVANYQSARSQLQLANKYYSDQFKVYKEGQLLYIELVDALNQLTNTQVQLSIAKATVQTALAEIERNQATYPINNN